MKEETGRLDGRLAYARLPGLGPGVVFLPGFRSDMQGSKALALRRAMIAQGRALLRFDYSGHGEQQGDPSAHRGSDQHLGAGRQRIEGVDRVRGPGTYRAILEAPRALAVAGVVEAQQRAALRRAVVAQRQCL